MASIFFSPLSLSRNIFSERRWRSTYINPGQKEEKILQVKLGSAFISDLLNSELVLRTLTADRVLSQPPSRIQTSEMIHACAVHKYVDCYTNADWIGKLKVSEKPVPLVCLKYMTPF